MKNKIEYYLKLPYTRELVPEPEGGWFVRIRELPGCMSQGDTPEEALEMITDAMRGWLEVELENGGTIPAPRMDEDYSGKVVVRVPKSLHRKLVTRAEEEGVSLNQWILAALAEAMGNVKVPRIEKMTPGDQPLQAFSAAIHKILQDVGMQLDTSLSEEACFANWLQSNFEDIQSNYQQSDFEQSLARIGALAETLSDYENQSPLIRVFSRLADNQIRTVEKTMKINQQAVIGDQFQLKIRELMVSMYENKSSEETLSQNKEKHLWALQERAFENLDNLSN
jgi:antitoxin HicB